MTYSLFHLIFILPPILLLAYQQPQPLAGVGGRKAGLSLLLIAMVAFVYTTPWDNYLIWRDVWHYGRDRVLGTVGYVPIEEYLFFVLQPILTGLWLYRSLANAKEPTEPKAALLNLSMIRPPSPPSLGGTRTQSPPKLGDLGGSTRLEAATFTPLFSNAPKASPWANTWANAGGALIWIGLSLAGAWLLQRDFGVYLGLILVWAGPILALQWLIGGAQLWARKSLWLSATLVPTLYLWICDRIAIGQGIWHISEVYTTGLHLFGLPIEEATFFLVTNFLVVQGLLLLLIFSQSEKHLLQTESEF